MTQLRQLLSSLRTSKNHFLTFFSESTRRDLPCQVNSTRAKFVKGHWVVSSYYYLYGISIRYLSLDVYNSAMTSHLKRTIFYLDSHIIKYEIYFDSGDADWKAVLLLSKKLNRSEIVEKIAVNNLLVAEKETQFNTLKSLKLTDYRGMLYFNPERPQIVAGKAIPERGRALVDAHLGRGSRMEFRFYDHELEMKFKVESSFSGSLNFGNNFRWLGDKKCCLSVGSINNQGGCSSPPQKLFLVIDMNSKVAYEIEVGGGDSFFENTEYSMIFSSRNLVLFSETFTNRDKTYYVSDEVKMVDISFLGRGKDKEYTFQL